MRSAGVGRRLDPLLRFARSDFARHGFLVFAASSLVNLCNYLFHVFISRVIGVEAYGTLSSLIAALTIAAIPTTVATMIVVKYAAEFHAVGDDRKIAAMLDGVLRYGTGAAILSSLVACAFARPIGAFLRIDDLGALTAAALVLATSLILPIVRGVLQGMQDFRGFAISTVIEGVGKLLLGVAMVAAGAGVTGAIGGFLLGGIASFVYTVIAAKHGVRARPEPFHIEYARLVQTTRGVAFTMLSLTVLGFCDMLLVKHFFAAEVAGLFGAASLAGKMLYFIVGFAPTIVLPKATHRAMRGESPRPILIQATVLTLAASAAALVVFALFPTAIIESLAGRAFGDAAPLLFPYGVAMTLLAVTSLCANYRIGIHQFHFVLPLALTTVGEIAAIALFHHSVAQVVADVAIGNGVALLTVVTPPNMLRFASLGEPVAEQAKVAL